jgi:hypothetical protein
MRARTCLAVTAMLLACGGSFQVTKDERPDGTYYDMACPDWKECVSFAHQRCPDGFETVEKRRHATIVRCTDVAPAPTYAEPLPRPRPAPTAASTADVGPEGF